MRFTPFTVIILGEKLWGFFQKIICCVNSRENTLFGTAAVFRSGIGYGKMSNVSPAAWVCRGIFHRHRQPDVISSSSAQQPYSAACWTCTGNYCNDRVETAAYEMLKVTYWFLLDAFLLTSLLFRSALYCSLKFNPTWRMVLLISRPYIKSLVRYGN